MTNVQSKCLAVTVPCNMYVHPWTESCWNSAAGQILHSLEHSSRIYAAVYMLSLLMRGRIPTIRDLQRTFLGIIQSTGFLATNGCAYLLFACALRNLFGAFHFWTIAYTPAFLASLTAIIIERPTRRPLLCLYVANLATETIWRMAVSRNLVQPIPYGETIIFGLSTSILLYLYRLGVHKTYAKDSLFNVLKFVIGQDEEGKILCNSNDEMDRQVEEILDVNNSHRQEQNEIVSGIRRRNINDDEGNQQSGQFRHISNLVQIYMKFLKILKTMPKHKSCPHNNGCLYYSVRGGIKQFGIGIGLQVALKLALQIKKIFQFKLKFRKTIFNKATLKLGLFLGGFSFLFRSLSCSLRHITGSDSPKHAIPAGFIASFAFTKYPDVTIALYVMWKMLQITYNIGIEKGYLPQVPGFTILLYCASTATLFHAAALEPQNLRPSYWKFLNSNSGGRVCHMDRREFDIYGLNSHQQALAIQKLTNTENPKITYPMQ